MKPRDHIRDANQTARHVDCSLFKVKGDRPPTDCAQHVVNECILASSLIQDRLCDGTVGMHHDRSSRPQRGPPSHCRGYSTDFFIVNMHSGHFGPNPRGRHCSASLRPRSSRWPCGKRQLAHAHHACRCNTVYRWKCLKMLATMPSPCEILHLVSFVFCLPQRLDAV